MFSIINKLKKQLYFSMELDRKCMLSAYAAMAHVRTLPPNARLSDAEVKVFSQWGEDGIIQYLLHHLSIPGRVFVEFGSASYLESNTRFLLMNNNWSGILFDGSKRNIRFIQNDDIYWKYEILARQAFITRENINLLIEGSLQRLGHLPSEVDILSIDIDGNDYWIWDAVNVIFPRIVICEYNSLLGSADAITVPYRADFSRRKAHYSCLYAGASLPALVFLAEAKGYIFIGCNSAGNNAFFLRKDYAQPFQPVTIEDGYVRAKFRESRNVKGKLSYKSFQEQLSLLAGMSVIDVIHGDDVVIKNNKDQ